MSFENCKTEQDYIEGYRKLLDEHGVKALSRKWLIEQGYKQAYDNACQTGLNGEKLAAIFDKSLDFKYHVNGLKSKAPKFTKWTEDSLNIKSLELIDNHGCIPPTEWLQENNLYGFSNAIRQRFGGIHEWRLRYTTSNEDKPILISRSGLRHLSMSEVFFANFLWMREIQIFTGGRYPQEYSNTTGKKLGKYDLEFIATYEQFAGKRILVEIFGGPRTKDANRREDYEKTKEMKIKFHADCDLFLWLDYKDCYSENKLKLILMPYIGLIEPSRLEQEYDNIFYSSALSVADYVMQKCQNIIDNVEDGKMPGTNWLLKMKPYENREIFSWEDDKWTTLTYYIDLLGGISKVRDALNQSDFNMIRWTPSLVIQKLSNFFIVHRRWPITIFNQINAKKSDERSQSETSLMNQAKKINTAIERHFVCYSSAYQEACLHLPNEIRPSKRQMQNAPQKWFPDVVIRKLADFYIAYHEWPGSTYNRLKKMKDYLLEDQYQTYLESHRLNDVIQKNFESFAEAYNKARELIPLQVRPEISDTSRNYPVGVCPTQNGKFRAGIGFKNKSIDLGTYDTVEKAANAYLQALDRKKKGLTPKA